VADVEIDGKYLKLTIRDTAGQDDYYKSRLLSYRDQNIVLMSFAIDSPDEMDIILDNVCLSVLALIIPANVNQSSCLKFNDSLQAYLFF